MLDKTVRTEDRRHEYINLERSVSGASSDRATPDPIPNSVVKRCIADGSVGFPHVRVGHRQAPTPKPPIRKLAGGFTISTGVSF